MEDIEDMFVNQQDDQLLDNRRPFKKRVDRKQKAQQKSSDDTTATNSDATASET